MALATASSGGSLAVQLPLPACTWWFVASGFKVGRVTEQRRGSVLAPAAPVEHGALGTLKLDFSLMAQSRVAADSDLKPDLTTPTKATRVTRLEFAQPEVAAHDLRRMCE
jgi:hypothetical protein